MLNLQKRLPKEVQLPEDYKLVEEHQEIRNKQEVTVLRYQKAGVFTYNGPRVTAIFAGETLISLKDYTEKPTGKLVSPEQARKIAIAFFEKTNRTYAHGLSFIRIDDQTRFFNDITGRKIEFPVQWIKFGHQNGSYNWVTLGGGGKIIEMEIDSRWDYFRGRKKTEMWDNDDWVLARNGQGPQLASPNALA